MSRAIEKLESRVARLETELAELKAAIAGKPPVPWYRQIVGEYAGDKDMAEIARLGRLIRQGKLKG